MILFLWAIMALPAASLAQAAAGSLLEVGMLACLTAELCTLAVARAIAVCAHDDVLQAALMAAGTSALLVVLTNLV